MTKKLMISQCKKPCVALHIEGGVLQQSFTNIPGVIIAVMDLDNRESDITFLDHPLPLDNILPDSPLNELAERNPEIFDEL